jgi:ubiquinone/menaquinone biosynthesis C-methylase UbiE
MPLINHFDILAPFYDRVFGSPEPQKLIQLAELPVEGRLLDAGGGTGRVSEALKDRVSEAVVVDLSSGMLRQATAKNDLATIRSQTELLPFLDQSFDRVIMVDALHHVYHQGHTIKELWRVLKPGGRIVIEEPDVDLMVVKIVALMEKIALMRSHFLSPCQIEALFSFGHALTHIEREGITAWIVAEKPPNA